MELTEKELRDRGIQRSADDIAEEARRFVSYVISEMPTGRWATDPAKEFSEEEITALEEGGLDLSPQEEGGPDPLARTVAKYVALLASALTTKEAAEVLEVGESRIRQRLREGTLYGVKAGRENRLPIFQFEGGKEVPGIAQVLKHVDRSLHPVAVLNWFMVPNHDLFVDEEEASPVSPRHWLLSGGDPEVLGRLAEDL
ncbi:MAG: helix-turn-helix domain-containing protein [Actinomycetota bacterium]|nr:helix-turn-helix domain-containing protein [Actinomycetota bacterium]